jgi:hypothetical protein
MNEVKYLLKFGERNHLESLQKGNLYFSNAMTFRYYEENLFIKGQGDRLEGGSFIAAQNLTMIDNENDDLVFTGVKGNIFIHYEPANLLPVYCLFTCFDKDCVEVDGSLRIRLSEDIKQSIISHFPKADTVAIIKNPEQFINDVYSTIGFECKSDTVKYFHLLGFGGEFGKANDLAYFKYLSQDIPPKKENGKKVYSFNAQYVYRSLLCKDVFFEKEQEYRFILPEINIEKAREFNIKLSEDIELHDLVDLYSM